MTNHVKEIVAIVTLGILGGGGLLLSVISNPASAQTTNERGHDPTVLRAGRTLFRKNCAVCHGWDAEGITPDWQVRNEDGKLPPPPLNGTAHAWHHPTSVLTQIVKDGTAKLGGTMPAWRDELSDADIMSILQWITSLWPDELYEAWLARDAQNN